MSAKIDETSKKWGVTVYETPNALWAVDSVKCVLGHTMNIYYQVLGADGKPRVDVSCMHFWPDGQLVQKTNANGETNFTMGIAGAIHVDQETGVGRDGPYEAFVESRDKSEVVRGMGIPVGLRDVEFQLMFKPKQPEVTLQEFMRREATKEIANAKGHKIPINSDAWLYKCARKRKLGSPRSYEFDREFGGITYRIQAYQGGLVLAEMGKWDAAHTQVIVNR